MQATVALVTARPETILDDYRRVMELAGIAVPSFTGRPALLAGRERGGWFPGSGSPPWQLDGVLQALEGTRSASGTGNGALAPESTDISSQWDVVAVDAAGGGLLDPAGGWGWEEVLARHGAVQARVSDWENSPVHSDSPLPALTSALPAGLRFPPPLKGRSALLLPVLRILPGWPLAGSTAMLQGLLGPRRRKLRVPLSEVRAESVAFAKEMFPDLYAVMDATLWGVARGSGRHSVARNVLIAGDDPVAVDAVAARLAGLEPRIIPWMRLCAERKLGAVSESDIRLVGSRELLDLDFQVSPANLGSSGAGSSTFPVGNWFWRRFQRPRILRKHRSSPWGRLFQEYKEYRPGSAERGME